MRRNAMFVALVALLLPVTLLAADTPGFGDLERGQGGSPQVRITETAASFTWTGGSLVIDAAGVTLEGKTPWRMRWPRTPQVDLHGEYDARTLEFAFPFLRNGAPIFLCIVEQDGQHALVLDHYDNTVQAEMPQGSKLMAVGSVLRRIYDGTSTEGLLEFLRALQEMSTDS